MGSTTWQYWVSYQPDIQAALDLLRKKVFEALPGSEKARAEQFMAEEYLLALAHESGFSSIEGFRADAPYIYDSAVQSFALAGIESRLVLSYGFEGTGTVLDVDKVGEDPQTLSYTTGWMRALSESQYLEFFGTIYPTKLQIMAYQQRKSLADICGWYEGVYVIAYNRVYSV